MDEQEIKAHARLYALEWAVCQVWANSLMQTGMPESILKEIRGQAMMGVRQLTFPTVDSAMSDLFAGETEVAVDRLLGILQTILETRRKPKKP